MNTVLMGAEGVAELESVDWIREATEEEISSFKEYWGVNGYITIDGVGRPYWYMTMLDHAPDEAKDIPSRYFRVLRIQ